MPATTSSRTPLFWALTAVGVVLAAMVAVAVVIVATGRGGAPRAVGLQNIPMIPATRVMTTVRSCDRGANSYCSVQVVLVGTRPQSSAALRATYRQRLHQLGWTTTRGASGNETGADSPGHELRLTFATAYEDLLGVDSNWIQRTAAISHALSSTMFDRAPALSVMLLRGSS